jgi:hypothetical protein
MHMMLDAKTQKVAESREPKVFSPQGEERAPLRLLQCLSSVISCKPHRRKHLLGTEM